MSLREFDSGSGRKDVPAALRPSPGRTESGRERIVGERPRILLADDEPGVRAVCRRVLEGLEVSVVEAASGPDAIARWEEERGAFDAAVLDICMPGCSGIQVFHYMRRESSALQIVLMTGSGFPEECSQFRNVSLLSKPFGLQEFRKLAREAIALP